MFLRRFALFSLLNASAPLAASAGEAGRDAALEGRVRCNKVTLHALSAAAMLTSRAVSSWRRATAAARAVRPGPAPRSAALDAVPQYRALTAGGRSAGA